MEKIIFLDIDGVINTFEYPSEIDKYGVTFDPLCIKHLETILVKTNAKIVISSTWRIKYGLQGMKDIWKYRNILGDIIDITPILNNVNEWDQRGLEISKWLKYNCNIESYVILDDAMVGIDNFFPENYVRCDGDIGITKNEVNKCINILNNRIYD